MNLSGPWWTNDKVCDAETEYPPQEAFFRIEFSGSDAAELQLAAANFYQVWLNGTWLAYGPARASHGRLTVDTWVLPEHMLRAQNTLTIQILWEGVFTFDHVRGTPGVWLALEREGVAIPYDMRVSERTGRLARQRYSHQRGWLEQVDARECAQGWPGGPWDDNEWTVPVQRLQDPRVALEKRDIKPFTFSAQQPQTVMWVGAGDLEQRVPHRPMGYAQRVPAFEDGAESPARAIQEEQLLPSTAGDRNLGGLLTGGRGPMVLASAPAGYDRTIHLDFGEEISGLFEWTVSAPAGTVIEVGWSEVLWQEEHMGCWARSSQPDGAVPPREFCDSYQAIRYICRGDGEETFQSLFLAALRYARLAFRCPPGEAGAVSLHQARVRKVGYPLTREGNFRCSDESLNRIYEATVATLTNAVFDVFMDCPGRERGSWLNDSYWTAAGFMDVTGDAAFERRFLRQFIDSQDAMPLDGMVAPMYPSDCRRWRGNPGGLPPITGHSLFWLIQVERHLRLHGTPELRGQWRPALERQLAAFAGYRNAAGLLDAPPWETFLDWSRFESGPIQTADNALYALALTRLGAIFEHEPWREAGRQTWTALDASAWNGDRELYADTIRRDDDGTLRPGAGLSAISNLILLWTGFVARGRADRVWRQVVNFHPLTLDRPLFGYETGFVRGNLYSLPYRFDVAGRRGELPCLVRDMKEAFQPMFERGQTTLGEHLGCEGSFCHGLNGYVAHVMIRYLAGIELPEQPGGMIRIQPNPELLAWCQARVPWMGGYVQVWWDRSSIMISLPKGCRGEFIKGKTGIEKVSFTDSYETRSTR